MESRLLAHSGLQSDTLSLDCLRSSVRALTRLLSWSLVTATARASKSSPRQSDSDCPSPPSARALVPPSPVRVSSVPGPRRVFLQCSFTSLVSPCRDCNRSCVRVICSSVLVLPPLVRSVLVYFWRLDGGGGGGVSHGATASQFAFSVTINIFYFFAGSRPRTRIFI